MRVDNQKSTAVIYNILVDGVASSTECGFVKYKDKGRPMSTSACHSATPMILPPSASMVRATAPTRCPAPIPPAWWALRPPITPWGRMRSTAMPSTSATCWAPAGQGGFRRTPVRERAAHQRHQHTGYLRCLRSGSPWSRNKVCYFIAKLPGGELPGFRQFKTFEVAETSKVFISPKLFIFDPKHAPFFPSPFSLCAFLSPPKTNRPP